MRRTTRSSNLGRSKCPRRPTTHHSITHHHHHHRRHHAHHPDPDLSLAGAPGPATEPPSLPRASFFSPHTFLSDLSMIDVPLHYILTLFFFFFVRLYIPPGLCIPLDITIACAYYKLCRWRSARPCATLTDSLCVIAVQRLDLTRHVTTPPPRHRRLPPHAIRNPLPLSTHPPPPPPPPPPLPLPFSCPLVPR